MSANRPMERPKRRPNRPHFGSGPTAKRPGWSVEVLRDALVGRSHRSAPCRARLREVIVRSRELLGLPADWKLAVMPGSDTGAFEAALWNLLGPRGVDVMVFDSFGEGWRKDVQEQLRLADVRVLRAPYGELPDLGAYDPSRDLVLCWNGTTSGVCVPHGEWIPLEREGLVLCDATSAVFAVELPWERLDAVTWSWQKVLGGEAQHGMLALSPRALARLAAYRPPWPLPKLFRIAKDGVPLAGLFDGDTINTPSMLAVEDALDALRWLEGTGGLAAAVARCRRNAAILGAWVARTPWVDALAARPEIRSPTCFCLTLADPAVRALEESRRRELVRRLVGLLEREGVAFDIAAYREAPAGLRIWTGATVDAEDLEALLPWLDWAWAQVAAEFAVNARAEG